jgi:hypothetical protein
MCCSIPREQNVQPLDFYFRQYKIYVRRTDDHTTVCLHDTGIKLQDHSFTLKMHLMVYDQLGASAYANIILYAWKKPHYVIRKTCDTSVNMTAVLFTFGLETCFTDGCTTFSFIGCSYSTCFYCFEHFIPNPHLHFDVDHDDVWNNMSFSCATMIFATLLITFNKHF